MHIIIIYKHELEIFFYKLYDLDYLDLRHEKRIMYTYNYSNNTATHCAHIYLYSNFWTYFFFTRTNPECKNYRV